MVENALATTRADLVAVGLWRRLFATVDALLQEATDEAVATFFGNPRVDAALTQLARMVRTAILTHRRIRSIAGPCAAMQCFASHKATAVWIATVGHTILEDALGDIAAFLATRGVLVITTHQALVEQRSHASPAVFRRAAVVNAFVKRRPRVPLALFFASRRRGRFATSLQAMRQDGSTLTLALGRGIATVSSDDVTIREQAHTGLDHRVRVTTTTNVTGLGIGAIALIVDTGVVYATRAGCTDVGIITCFETFLLEIHRTRLTHLLARGRRRRWLAVFETRVEVRPGLATAFFGALDIVIGEPGETFAVLLVNFATATLGARTRRNVFTTLQAVVQETTRSRAAFLGRATGFEAAVQDTLGFPDADLSTTGRRGRRVTIAVHQALVEDDAAATGTVLGVASIGDTLTNVRTGATLAELFASRRDVRTVLKAVRKIRCELFGALLGRASTVFDALVDSALDFHPASFGTGNRGRAVATTSAVGKERRRVARALFRTPTALGALTLDALRHERTRGVTVWRHGNRIRNRNGGIALGEKVVADPLTLRGVEIALEAALVGVDRDLLTSIGADNHVDLRIHRRR